MKAPFVARRMPTTPKGIVAPPAGALVRPGLARYDPRWMRPLPWTTTIASRVSLKGFLFVVGLALLNVVLPLVILRLAAHRRPWTTRLLMALPVAAAIPLSTVLTLEPLLSAAPPFSCRFPPRRSFALGTLAGLPVVAYGALIGWAVIRRTGGHLPSSSGSPPSCRSPSVRSGWGGTCGECPRSSTTRGRVGRRFLCWGRTGRGGWYRSRGPGEVSSGSCGGRESVPSCVRRDRASCATSPPFRGSDHATRHQ